VNTTRERPLTGKVAQAAELVAFVAGPESSFINGVNLTADGGINA
jgi:NAD(P)-dependent dehydrogenase (short-subunit alcohol dehydrogenase family)